MLFLRSTLSQKREGSAIDLHVDVEISSRFIVEGKLRTRSEASAPGKGGFPCVDVCHFFVDSLFFHRSVLFFFLVLMRVDKCRKSPERVAVHRARAVLSLM